MHIELNRFAYTPTETQGRLTVGDWSAWTIERPWVPGEHPGGQPFASCIPDGDYDLVPLLRPNGDRVFAFVNESLGVHLYGSKGDAFRYLCLIHAANYAREVEGCVAPGESRIINKGQIMVTNSRATMKELLARLSWEETHTITIKPALGTVSGGS